MHKKLLFISLLTSLLINFNNLNAETTLLIPLKKPSLTDKEIIKKLSVNILKPLKKPIKNKNIKIKEKKIVEEKKLKKDKK